MLLFVLKVNLISCLPFVQLVCAPELALLIFMFPTRVLILESAHLLTLLSLFSIALTLHVRQIACVPPSSIIFSSRLNNFKQKLFILFLNFASIVFHLDECVMIVIFLFILTVLEGN